MIVAGGGNDVVHGLDGNDEICGPGNDRLLGQVDSDDLAGQGGRDRLNGGGGSATVVGDTYKPSSGKADRLKGLDPLAAPALPAYRRFTP